MISTRWYHNSQDTAVDRQQGDGQDAQLTVVLKAALRQMRDARPAEVPVVGAYRASAEPKGERREGYITEGIIGRHEPVLDAEVGG